MSYNKKVTGELKEKVVKEIAKGDSIRVIANKYELGVSTIFRWKKELSNKKELINISEIVNKQQNEESSIIIVSGKFTIEVKEKYNDNILAKVLKVINNV